MQLTLIEAKCFVHVFDFILGNSMHDFTKQKLKAFILMRYHLNYMPDAVWHYRGSLFTVHVIAQLSACADSR